jgi:hypothetical protein
MKRVPQLTYTTPSLRKVIHGQGVRWVYVRKELVEGEDLWIERGVWRSSFAWCASPLQPFESSGKLQPQAKKLIEPTRNSQPPNLNYSTTMAALVNYGSSDEEDNFKEAAPKVNVSFVPVFLGDKLTAQIPGRETHLLTSYLYKWCQVW